MEEFKGTQGKWKAGRVKHSKCEFKGGHIYINSDDHSQMVKVMFSPSSLKKCKNNANLIAAAPELLQALQESQRLLNYLGSKEAGQQYFKNMNIINKALNIK